jgi:LuxR family maltose regulon positive regulatory protein
LRQRLQQTQPDSLLELHLRASTWCEQQGLVAEAVGHALAAEDFERALELVERGAESAMMRSQVTTLQGWVEALPDELVRTHPILCVYHTWALLLNGSPIEVAEARLQEAVDADPDGSIAGEVLALRALIATYQGKTGQSAELSRRALELLPEDRLFFRSFIAGYLGYSTLHRGDLVAARQSLEEAVRIGQQAGNLMNVVLALYHLAEVAMLEGRPDEARECYEQALAIAVDEQGQRQPIAGLALIGLGGLCILQANHRDAVRQITEGIERINGWGKAGAINGYVALAHVKRVQGDLAGAYEAIQTAERLAIEFSATTVDDVYVATAKAQLWLAQGNFEAVSRWIKELGLEDGAGLHLREKDGSGVIPFNRLLVHTLAARLHLAKDRPGEALRLLRPLRQMVETAGWIMYALRLLVLEALALQRQGDILAAMEPLGRALELCDPEGFAAFFVEEGAPMAELLRHAASRGVAPRQASDLLVRFEIGEGTALPSSHLPASSPRAQPLIEPLTERELDVLRFLATSLSTAEIADRLFVTVSTVRSHTKNIYAKLNVHRRWDAAARAQELKLI